MHLETLAIVAKIYLKLKPAELNNLSSSSVYEINWSVLSLLVAFSVDQGRNLVKKKLIHE